MAWIEVHDTLPDHPKTLRAAQALRLDADALLGKLIRLWTWALNHREDGVLSDLDAAILHRIMNFSGRADKLLMALLEARLLDPLPDGRYRIHDWEEHAGRLMEQRDRKRAQARERQRRHRAGLRREASEEDGECERDTARDEARGEARAETRDPAPQEAQNHAPTVPNRTLPYLKDDSIDDLAGLNARTRARGLACGKSVDNLLEAEIRETIREGFARRVGREPQEAELSGLCNLCGPGGMPTDMALLAVEQALLYGAQSVAGYACKTLFSWRKQGLYTTEAVQAWEKERAGETVAAP